MSRDSAILLLQNGLDPHSLAASGSYYTWNHKQEGAELIRLPEEELSRINHEVLAALKTLAELKVKDQDLLSFCEYNGFQLWFYHRFNIYFELREAFYLISAVKGLLTRHEEVLVSGSAPLLQAYFQDEKRLSWKAVTPGAAPQKSASTWKWASVYLARMWRSIWKKIPDAKYWVATGPSDLRITEDAQGRQVIHNPFLSAILNQGGAQLAELSLIELRSKSASMTEKDRARCSRGVRDEAILGERFLFLYILSLGWIRDIRQFRAHLQDVGEALAKVEDPMVKMYRKALMSRNYMSLIYFLQFKAYRIWMRKTRVKRVLVSNEYGPNQRSLIDAARAEGVEVCGIQHGAFHALHPGYTYSVRELQAKPLVDRFFSWGEKWSSQVNALNPGHQQKTRAVGIVRMDAVLKRQSAKKDEVFPGAQADDLVLLFATQPQRDEQLRRRAAEDAFSVLEQLPRVKLYLKLHPRETDEDFYHGIAREMGAKRYHILSGRTDLYAQLSLADAVLTCFSSVGTEAVLMRRPLIILDHLGQDVQGYISEGVALEARDAEQLTKVVASIMKPDFTIDEAAYARYIKDYATAMDGRSAQRVLEAFLN